MLNKLIYLVGLTVLMLSGCNNANSNITNVPEPSSTPEPTTGNLPTLTGDWSIAMTHSGGIMGLFRSVEINSAGAYTVTDKRGNKNVSGQLSETELADLIQVVNSTNYVTEKIPHGCADCFIYNIEIVGDSGSFSAQVDDISIEESGLSPLVKTLRDIIDRELK